MAASSIADLRQARRPARSRRARSRLIVVGDVTSTRRSARRRRPSARCRRATPMTRRPGHRADPLPGARPRSASPMRAAPTRAWPIIAWPTADFYADQKQGAHPQPARPGAAAAPDRGDPREAGRRPTAPAPATAPPNLRRIWLYGGPDPGAAGAARRLSCADAARIAARTAPTGRSRRTSCSARAGRWSRPPAPARLEQRLVAERARRRPGAARGGGKHPGLDRPV